MTTFIFMTLIMRGPSGSVLYPKGERSVRMGRNALSELGAKLAAEELTSMES